MNTLLHWDSVGRNDDDPHAACELLEEFRQRILRLVGEERGQYLLQGNLEEVEVEVFFFFLRSWEVICLKRLFVCVFLVSCFEKVFGCF